jgi:hypothetical protein
MANEINPRENEPQKMPSGTPNEPVKTDEGQELDSGRNKPEIDPGKLDNNKEIDLDTGKIDNSGDDANRKH